MTGKTLRAEMAALRLTQRELARRSGYSVQRMVQLCAYGGRALPHRAETRIAIALAGVRAETLAAVAATGGEQQ